MAKTILSCLAMVAISLALLAGAEWLASVTHLADRIALLEDNSTIRRGHHWGSSASHMVKTPEGFYLYKPWSGDGVTINELGLRTVPPAPKPPGEHRIAILGGSVVWGYLLADADTMPARLQAKIREGGRTDVTVYNFGIEGATIRQELALLKHFRSIYQIDHAIFYTGGNDIFLDYFDVDGLPGQQTRPRNFFTSLELYKVADKIGYSWLPPAKERLQKLNNLISSIYEKSHLVHGVKAVNEFCQETDLRCDIVLEPQLLTRKPLIGSEAKLASSSLNIFPKLDTLIAESYRTAVSLGPFVHDFSRSLNDGKDQVFLDTMHFNEAGTDKTAKTLLPFTLSKPPRPYRDHN
jgi:lysophospholipase L1-like esterase